MHVPGWRVEKKRARAMATSKPVHLQFEFQTSALGSKKCLAFVTFELALAAQRDCSASSMQREKVMQLIIQHFSCARNKV